MAVYDCCMFLNENDIYEMRINQHWDFVDKFIVLEAGESHTGIKKPFNFDVKRFEQYSEKLIYVTFDNFEEEMEKYPELDCPIGRALHKDVEAWRRDHFQANYLTKILFDQGAKDDDLVYISSADEIICKESFERAATRFEDKTAVFSGYDTFTHKVLLPSVSLRPIFGFQMRLYIYKLNMYVPGREWCLVGMITEVGNFKKIFPATIRSLGLTTHDHIANGGWHFTFQDNTDGEMVYTKQHSWAHAVDGIEGFRRMDTTTPAEALERLNWEYPLCSMIITHETHPEYILNNLNKLRDYII
jgi:beta-1,4-mannosyl-glycoprotein beta-1,4-N-acetylglucosaminyltransferase